MEGNLAHQSLIIHHSLFTKVIAILLIISMTLLFIPFPIEASWQPVQQSVDGFIEMLDQIDGQDTFTPEAQQGNTIFGKVTSAFGN